MKDGFLRVAAASVDVKVADPVFNKESIMKTVKKAQERRVKVLVLPELVMSAYTCGDLFWQKPLLEESRKQLGELLCETADISMVIVAGTPLVVHQKLYNCAVFMYKGRILGVVPKHYLPNYSEFYEARHFTPGKREVEMIRLLGQEVPFGMNILFCCENMENLVLAAEICEDLWVPLPPSTFHALAGATVICNPSASDETTTKDAYRRELVSSQSARLVCAYIYSSAGEGESTQDLVYSGHNMITEYGTVLAESERFENHYTEAEIDLERLAADRRKTSTFVTGDGDSLIIKYILRWKRKRRS